MELSPAELARYDRQTRIAKIGVAGQKKLKKASVLIVGTGGLGSPAALYLAAAGIGHLGLVDFDTVDPSNLQRQVLYGVEQSGQPKVLCARDRLQSLNPEIKIETHNERLTLVNAPGIFAKYNYILDGADNFATRYLTNDAAHFAKKPLISASVLGFEGQISIFNAEGGPCYRCLFPEPPPAGSVPSCAEAGVLGVVPGTLGVLQAAEVLKLILGLGESLIGKLLIYNALDLSFTKLSVRKNPDCQLCGAHPTITTLKEENFICSTDEDVEEISIQEFVKTWKNSGCQILDVREESEFSEGRLSYTHHIPLGDLGSEYQKLSQETPVVVYCRVGARSLSACVFLKKKGYRALNLQDGIRGFFQQGLAESLL